MRRRKSETDLTIAMGQAMNCDLLDFSRELQQRLESSVSLAHRKRCGQFFTPQPICRFMAGLLSLSDKQEYRLLDPGAGVGSLTAAVCGEFMRLKTPRRLDVHLFETDPLAAALLDENMSRCRRALDAAGHAMVYSIHTSDFIVAAGDDFCESRTLLSGDDPFGKFDGVIMNPPYFKISRDSSHARLMEPIVHGQPNMYSLFLALAAHLLLPEGELVAITPRSFCNGLYFRDFRRWFLQRMSLERLHLFESRTNTFEGAGILQESVITLSRRCREQSPTVEVSTSEDADIHEPMACQVTPVAKVIDNALHGCMIRIPTSGHDARIMELVESLPTRFAETGLRISTGPVVLFRAEEFLVEEPHSPDTVPLLLPHNVKPFETAWPIQKQRKPCAFRVCEASRRLLLPTKNYVLVKRFSAKEERRRLTAGCFFGARQPHDDVALENHLNYIYHGSRELSENEVYGIAALLNSALFDGYFRLISGSTQVNATELRTLRFPPLDVVEMLGKRTRASSPLPEAELEGIVQETIASVGRTSPLLAESVA